ncbi:CsbD family protein [Streptomyces sp. TLI_171]|uniref:CsbD family protein n=1 Tax=Streptomyces sp. TLI_171 TaxID=1938859 RepID=UPI000C5C9C0B|nr:CsbD family protein [Streptomyces sp. TLI_171]RKE17485.1 uncharacterized protein YjbJ (UPF0337 family) [Streptomyces sp. TLI_171]
MSDASDRLRHKAEEAAGAAKERVGAATGDDQLEGEGQAQQAGAQLKQDVDKAKDKAKEGIDKVKGAFKR